MANYKTPGMDRTVVMLDITLERIQDPFVRDALYNILEEVRSQPILKYNFKSFEVTFSEGVSDFPFKHNLGFKPKDRVITNITSGGGGYIDLDSATSVYVNITVSEACTMRFLLGNYDSNSQV